MDVLLSPVVADGIRTSLRNDTAIDSMVVDLWMTVPNVNARVDASVRYAAVYRAPAPVSPGDFVVMGGFADPDVANFALLNRNAMKADDLVGVDETVDKLFAKWSNDHVAGLLAAKDAR